MSSHKKFNEETTLAKKANSAMETFKAGLPTEDQQALAPLKPHVGTKSRRRPSDVFTVYGPDVLKT